MGQFTGSAPTGPFIPPANGGAWWPPAAYSASAGGLLPNPGASMFAFQFNGKDHGANFITLPRGLSARLGRTMTFETLVWLPAADQRTASESQPIVSRFNPRLNSGPANLDSHNDFALEVDGESGALRFWMGGGFSVDYGFDVRSPAALPTGEWVHVAVSVVSSESGNPFFALLFVDGVQVASQNWAQGAVRVFQSNEAIALGHRARGREAFYFEGVLDDVRFWSTARKAVDVARDASAVLGGDEAGLVALYKLDDLGDRLVHDAGLYGLHGYTLKPLFTLGAPDTLVRRETGVAGFPVEVLLGAVDLVPTAPDGFEFVLDCLPAHGCVSEAGDDKVQCATAADLGARVFAAGAVHYTADADYLGADELCYRARRVGESDFSLAATVEFDVIAAPDTGCVTMLDECGVCGGDGTSCTTGGCDGKGGRFDECMVCGGDNSSCQCAVYKSYRLDEMDFSLLDAAMNRTLVRIEHSVSLLARTLDGLAGYDAADGASALDLLLQVRHVCAAIQCVKEYSDQVAVFGDYLDGYFATNPYLAPEETQPQLLNYYEKKRLAAMN